MGFGWEGVKVRLVPLDIERHFDNALRWVNDPEVTQGLLIGDMPLTRLDEKEWFEKAMRTGGEDLFFAVETRDGRHIGFSGLHKIEWRHGVAISGTFIGEAADRGKGFGSDAAVVRARYAFEVLNLRLLMSGVLEGNDASVKMLAKAGYRECGRIPKRFWKRGAFRDEVLMVLERERWEAEQQQT
jgi:RimJ/RimL family protein N-acetyltransferase